MIESLPFMKPPFLPADSLQPLIKLTRLMKQTERNGEEISFNLNKNNNNRRQKRKDNDDRTEKTVMEHKREEMEQNHVMVPTARVKSSVMIHGNNNDSRDSQRS